MDEDKKYTIEEIKGAFWAIFHKSGETWFNNLGTDEENENSTESEWNDFVYELKGLR